jgi:hypothetical protein
MYIIKSFDISTHVFALILIDAAVATALSGTKVINLLMTEYARVTSNVVVLALSKPFQPCL